MSVDLAQTARLLVGDFLATVRAPMLSRRFQRYAVTRQAGATISPSKAWRHARSQRRRLAS